MKNICKVEGCERFVRANGFCEMHYAAERRREAGVPIRERKVCSEAGCGNFVKARGLCQTHWQRVKRREAGIQERGPRGRCKIDGCDDSAHARGYCSNHYQILKRNNDPLVFKRAPNGAGTINAHGYKMVSVGGKPRAEHRVVMERKIGRPLEKHESVHHMNGDRMDNRPENLELWSRSQPPGQRVEDKVNWAIELLRFYRPEVLA